MVSESQIQEFFMRACTIRNRKKIIDNIIQVKHERKTFRFIFSVFSMFLNKIN